MPRVFIIADIEGSSGCWDHAGSAFGTDEWARACVGMTKDVDAVARALFAAGVSSVTVKDFHRTGYNLLPRRIDRRARLIMGYRRGGVPGIGDPGGPGLLMMIGMHAPSGTDGFIAHTMTSRIARLEVNGELMSEAQLFAASLAPYEIRPVFFSGCPVACAQAQSVLRPITIHPIDKSAGPDRFDADMWRTELAAAAVRSLGNDATAPYRPEGPFDARIVMRDGEEAAKKLASRWGFDHEGPVIRVQAITIHDLYMALIRMCYLTPFIERILPAGLPLYNCAGWAGQQWVRWRTRAEG